MKKTPLNALHIEAGARMVDFGGWHMPVQYSSLTQEHHAVRTKAGLFDVSHMGEVTVEGEAAEKFLNFLLTNDVARLVDGQVQYTLMCQDSGGVIDDLLVYRRGPNKYLLCINASNIEKDVAWIEKTAAKFPGATVKNVSSEFCQIALQGPLSAQILSRVTDYDLAALKYYHFTETDLLGIPCLLSRTGYTGEDGFEIYAPTDAAPKIWRALMEAGGPLGLVPCGLGARDTLRTEAKFPLYGHEITLETNPLEAGLGWVVKLEKENFIGKSAIANVKTNGLKRQLVGIKVLDKGIPRQGYEVFDASQKSPIGIVTSGTLSPSLNFPIAIAYVANGQHTVGNKVSIKIRDRFFPAEIIKTPFYKRG